MSYTEVKVAGPTFEVAQVPLINLWDSAPQIEALGDYIFGIGAWTPSAGEEAARFAASHLRARSAAIINTNGEWSLDVSRIFASAFERHGGRIVQEISLNPTDTDLKSAALKLKGLRPAVIYAPFADNIPTFFKQLVMMKLGAPIITSDVMTEDVVSALGISAEGIYQTQTADPANVTTAAMLGLYRAKFGKTCERTLITSWGYDGIGLLTEAIRSSGSASQQIKDGLYKIKDFPGASGPINISPEGSSRTLERVFQINGGKFQRVEER